MIYHITIRNYEKSKICCVPGMLFKIVLFFSGFCVFCPGIFGYLAWGKAWNPDDMWKGWNPNQIDDF